MLDHSQQARIGAEQVLPEVCSALDKKFLVLPVGDFAQTPHQKPVAIVLDQTVPIAAPNYLDYIPTSAAENCLKFLNNFSIAAHRTIEALQVAVDHPD